MMLYTKCQYSRSCGFRQEDCCVLSLYEGHPIKNETFFYSALNLHARLMKSCSKLAHLFGSSLVPCSTCYVVPTVVARQH